MTMRTYTLPDTTIASTDIPAGDWDSDVDGWNPWTPASWTTVGSVGGYTYSIACGDATAYAYSSDWNRPKYWSVFLAKIQGNGIADEYGGYGSASAVDRYQQVMSPPPAPGDPPTYEYVGTDEYDQNYSGEIASSFSRTDGQVVKLWGDMEVTENACSISDLKLYVWS
jgi:hypothetical protein